MDGVTMAGSETDRLLNIEVGGQFSRPISLNIWSVGEAWPELDFYSARVIEKF